MRARSQRGHGRLESWLQHRAGLHSAGQLGMIGLTLLAAEPLARKAIVSEGELDTDAFVCVEVIGIVSP